MNQTERWDIGRIAAQCIFPRLETDKFVESSEYKKNIHSLVKFGVGGFCIFNGDPNQVEIMIQELQSLSETPLLFAADFEYGLPMRLTEGTSFPHAMALGKTLKPENSKLVGKAIAKEAKALGILWNLAPVCDINSNPDNSIINIRSFGEDAEIVSEHSAAYIEGTQGEKVVACAKHFPGHGDTEIDSHLELPAINNNIDKLYSLELKPFESAISAGVKSIMLGHLSVPAIDNSGLPASLSKVVVKFLREALKFNGIIITDALDMNAITSRFNDNEAVLMALKAGNDIALMPMNPVEAIKYLTEIAENDIELSIHLKKSAEKIYNLKRWCGLIPQFLLLTEKKQIFIEHMKMALRFAYQALEFDGDLKLIPIPDKISFAGFAFLQRDNDLQNASRFFTMLSQATENDCDYAFVDDSITIEQINDYKEGIKDSDLLIFGLFYRAVAYHGSITISENILNAINEIAGNKRKIIILFGNPYIKKELKSDLFISTFSDSFASLAATVVALTGRKEALNY
jgi:beta-glucosidase-like glycosyl hydrolase